MPQLSRWFIRTALGYLLLSLFLGVLLPGSGLGARLWPSYVHLLVLGWLTQLIFGVAYWMFPRASAGAARRSAFLGWTTYWLLNAGLVGRFLGELARAAGGHSENLLVAAAFLQLAAGWTFVINTWPRVKSR
jgi:hypothetical protein